jgi:hypothetical protein
LEEILTLMRQAIDAIKAGDTELGQQLLIEVLEHDEDFEGAWLWMTRCVSDPEVERECFERVLAINPDNVHAIRGLQRMDGLPMDPLPKKKKKGCALPGIGGVLVLAVLALAASKISLS